MPVTYFATDGSYGDAEDIIIVDTSKFSEEELEAVEDCTDSVRHEIVAQIIENSKPDSGQLTLPIDAGQ